MQTPTQNLSSKHQEQVRWWGFLIEFFLGLHLIYYLTYWSIFHFYFTNHTFQWKFSTWFFVVSTSPACCLALSFPWITWLNLMHEFDRHLAERTWRKGLREVLGKRPPWESPAEHSAAPGEPVWATQEWGPWIHKGFLSLPKHSPSSSTSWLCQCIPSNQTAILWFLPIQILPILRVTFKMHPHRWCLLSFLLPTLSGEWFSPPPMNACRLGSFYDFMAQCKMKTQGSLFKSY